ncbi:hypothetical protein DKX38_003824 [Salix brachista]|uniref:Uncharacterized protein n=1 Tax=Salix brachista TaxID=2182728 RepID=A0A5N5N8N0_9ROSI|nr:hypothetical protein DKX38_003824 [Salix brachista]
MGVLRWQSMELTGTVVSLIVRGGWQLECVEITERLRDPRGLRRGGLSAAAFPRNLSANGARPRGFVRSAFYFFLSPSVNKFSYLKFFFKADRNNADYQPPAKRRLLSAVVRAEAKPYTLPLMYLLGIYYEAAAPVIEPLLRIRIQDWLAETKECWGNLLGIETEKFWKEDMKISVTEAFIQRSNALQRAEQKAQEEQERLRQREQISEQRRRDLVCSNICRL